MRCTLCDADTILYKTCNNIAYFSCNQCSAVCMDSQAFPNLEDEQKRYETHNNDVLDLRYQQFVSPITDAVKLHYPTSASGLDYGSGTGPVITHLLREQGFEMTTYDPIFDKNKSAMKQQYDFIVCCEVVEHFHNPLQEFIRLQKLLLPRGKLYCMTSLFYKDLNFEDWYYKNDPTHVIFYSRESFYWIKEHLEYSNLIIDEHLIVLSK